MIFNKRWSFFLCVLIYKRGGKLFFNEWREEMKKKVPLSLLSSGLGQFWKKKKLKVRKKESMNLCESITKWNEIKRNINWMEEWFEHLSKWNSISELTFTVLWMMYFIFYSNFIWDPIWDFFCVWFTPLIQFWSWSCFLKRCKWFLNFYCDFIFFFLVHYNDTNENERLLRTVWQDEL